MEFPIMVGETSDQVQRRLFSKVQISVQSYDYQVILEVVLNMLRKDAIGETLEVHTAKNVDTDAAAKEWLKKLPALASFVAPVATPLRREAD